MMISLDMDAETILKERTPSLRNVALGQRIIFVLGTVFTHFNSHLNRRSTLD